MSGTPLRRLALNDALRHGLFAVRGESGTIWVLDWQGAGYGASQALRIRTEQSNVGFDDNKWLHLARMSAINPDDPHDERFWEIRVGWRHRWEHTWEDGSYPQTACVSIEPVTAEEVEQWLQKARLAPERPISPEMDPFSQLSPGFRRLLGLDGDPDEDPAGDEQ